LALNFKNTIGHQITASQSNLDLPPRHDKLTADSDAMPIIFPAANTLCEVFGSASPFSRPKPKAPIREHPLKSPIFSAWSAIDNVKDKAGQLSNEAVREYEKASTKAQQKAGNIELYSSKYYAACTVGGILACVNLPLLFDVNIVLTSPRVQPTQRSLHLIWSNVDARSTRSSTRATSRLGERLVGRKAFEASLLAGVQLSSATRCKVPLSMADTSTSSTFTLDSWEKRMPKNGRPVYT
jgi:hypothetical protein